MNTRLPTAPDFAAIEASAAESARQRQEVLSLVGNLVFSWSNNESMFIYVTMVLLETDFSTAAVTFVTLNTTRARLDLVRRLAKTKVKDEAIVRRLERLIERFNECTKVRNEFNHCIYQLDDKGRITHTNVLRVVETRTSLQYAIVRPIDDERRREITNTIKRLIKLNRDLWAFLPELSASMPGKGKQRVTTGTGGGEPPAVGNAAGATGDGRRPRSPQRK